MASTSTNIGIEKIGDGEQEDLWGLTTNDNLDFLDEAIAGVLSLALSSTAETLSVIDWTSNEALSGGGRHMVVRFTGSPGGTCTVTISPSDLQKVYLFDNTADQSVIIKQGSAGSTVTIPSGDRAIVYCDGAGATSGAVREITTSVDWANVAITGGSITGITDLAVADGGTGSSNSADARIALDLEIGVDVQGYDSTILVDADIGVNVQGYDSTILNQADLESSPTDGETAKAPNSDWAHDHAADTSAHGGPYNNYIHPSYTVRTEGLDTGPLTGATVISDLDFNLSSDDEGHVTVCDFTNAITRELTLADLGYTGSATANDYTHPNHTGQVTSAADGATALDVTAISAQTSTSTVADTDEMLINDGGALRKVAVSDLGDVLGSGAWEMLSNTTPTAVNAIDLTWDESLYSEIKIIIAGVAPATDDTALYFSLGYSNGASFSSDHDYRTLGRADEANDGVGTDSGSILISRTDTATAGVGNGANEALNAVIRILPFESGIAKYSANAVVEKSNIIHYTGDLFICPVIFADASNNTAVFDTIKFFWASGDYAVKGSIYMYGLKIT